ncbi:MAG TPA: BamA/TamA family outer membrane protein [Novosphingobium sp.]|nr:BamA/TamA family outer membrane protein [Novosphingobium sp.]
MASRLVSRLAIAALLLAAQPALAQDRTADPDLEALIPDAALANPEAWAKGEPRPLEPIPEIDPSSPLAEIPGFTLPWPDDAEDLPQLAPLEPDPDVQLALQPRDEPAASLQPGGEVINLTGQLALVFPAGDDSFPERGEFAIRFRNLSTLVRLSGSDDDNIAQVAVRARSDRDLLQRLLRVYGYYDAQVVQTVGGIEPRQDVAVTAATVRFDVLPGTRYRFGAIELAALPATGEDFTLLRSSYKIQPGDPLSSDAIVGERFNLDTALGENGYAFASTGEPDLLVDHAREEGDLTQPVTPGGKYRFGAVVSELPDFLSSHHLEEIARFKRGEVFKRSLSDDLRRAVLATGLVSSVTVTPRETAPPAGGQPGEVALDIGMTKAPLRTIAGAIGYDSGDGFRVEASWEHRNLFPPEGMLRVRGVAGTKEQLAGVTFRRNNFKGRDQVLTLDLYADNVNRDAYAARTVAFSASFEKLTTLIFQKPWVWSGGLEVLLTDERESTVAGAPVSRKTYKVAALPLRAAYDGSDSLLDPTRGFRAALRVSPEVSFQSGTAMYTRIQADASFYQRFGDKIVLAARARLGTIPGAALTTIAPSRRFYAGGGGSVRGYGYQAIGPRDVLGDPSGGRALSEFSLEARVKTGLLGGAVSLVPFIDAGAVDETVLPRLRDIRYGAGIGLRYQTGFGPIRIDVGTPLNPRPGDSRIAVYVALGQAF